MKNIFKRKKVLLISSLICILLSALMICFIIFSGNIENSSFNFIPKIYKELNDIKAAQVGENAIVSSIGMTKRITGEGPFDSNDEPGNDSSATNNIVRSFDQVSWYVAANMSIKNNEGSQKEFTGGIIEVKAELPESCSNKVKWNTESMNWLEDAKVSEDGRTVEGKYTLPSNEITIPGQREFAFILNVLGAENGLELKPTITLGLYGNEESEKQKLELSNDNQLAIVSAAPKYNVKLTVNNVTSRATVNIDDTEVDGRMHGYSAILQLVNDDPSKGMKGIEVPQGEVSFDINLKLERYETHEDVTSICTPILWNYKINQITDDGNIENRTMNFGNKYFSCEQLKAPLGVKTSERDKSVYNSGNVVMKQNGNKITVTIDGYEFDGIFPKTGYNSTDPKSITFKDNEGCFSVIYFQILVPDEDENNHTYYLTVSDNNFKAKSQSSNNITTQQYTDDDDLKNLLQQYSVGSFSHKIYTRNIKNEPMQKPYTAGNGYAYREETIFARSHIEINPTNDKDDAIKSIDRFFKFDAEGFEPTKVNNQYYTLSNALSKMKFKMWFVTKKDGTNWKDQTEMNNGVIENMNLYNTIEEIPEGYNCVGMYFESISGEITPLGWDDFFFNISLKIKDTATIDNTYALTQTSKYWRKSLDREVYTQEKLSSYRDYPTPTCTIEKQNYKKTIYSYGEVFDGHNGGFVCGQTILVVGAEQSIELKSIDENTKEKVNYDFEKNEKIVTYQISPRIDGPDNKNGELENIKIKITVELPRGLTYIKGSCDYEEPEIIYNYNRLVWYKNDCTVNEEIKPIKFSVNINEDALNGQQYETTATMREAYIGISHIYKIGNPDIASRKATETIQIINLASYTMFKTTETPVIETNGEIHYKITASNRTDNPTTEFQLLDILPYNGDGRGTQYNGGYNVSRIDVKQTDLLTGNTIDSSKLNLYVTENDSVKSGVSAKDEDLGKTSIWKSSNAGNNINNKLTALAIIGTVEAKSKVEVDIYIKTENSKPNDSYINSASAQFSKEAALLDSPKAVVQSIKRQLEGKVWQDSNADGLINDNEEFLSNVKVTLLNEDGTAAIDVNNNEIKSVLTDKNGYYRFEDMVRGNYKIKIEKNDGEEITTKGVGTDEKINSKVNSDGYTDVITELNSMDEAIITVDNVNAGIICEIQTITVHYYEENTNKELSPDVVINGRVNTEYKTESAKDIPEYYELVNTPVNATGNITSQPIEVIYYYRLKNYNYEVNYLEKDTNKELAEKKVVSNVQYGTQIKSSESIKEIEGYSYNSCDKETLVIGTENNVINLYYTKDEIKTQQITYTVEYYKDGIKQEDDTQQVTKEIPISEDTVDVDRKDINTVDKYEGYVFDKTEPEEIPVMVKNGDVIKVYYAKKTKIVVNHIDKITGEILETVEENGKVGQEYTTNSKDFEDYVLTERPENETITLVDGENIVNYYYSHVSAGVIEKHVDIKSEKILHNEIHEGEEGTSYKIDSKSFEGYDLVSEKLPENAEGTMTIESIEVKYYYIRKTSVVAEYIDNTTGKKLTEDQIITGHEGDSYKTEEKKINDYELVQVPENATGTMKVTTNDEGNIITETIVKYYYKHKEKPPVVEEPEKPEEPVKPEQPVQPEVPVTPTKPEVPVTPAQQETPTTPAQPAQPAQPVTPAVQPEVSATPTTNSSNANTNKKRLPETGDDLPLATITTILFVIVLNVVVTVTTKETHIKLHVKTNRKKGRRLK